MTAVDLPAGACDCHTHVIGDRATYPMVADRHYTPALASHEDLLAHLARNGLQRVVIVQPSVYGTDNRCMLDSLDRLDGAGRGVAVLDESADDGSLRALHRRGVRGLRVNLESAGARNADAAHSVLLNWSERIAPLGWHLQVYAALDVIASLAERLATLPVPVVLDHFAMVPATTAQDDPRITPLLALLRDGNAYVKLSAPYRLAASGHPDREQVSAWARTFVQAAPERMLWGSDWPHTARDPGKAAHEESTYRKFPEDALIHGIGEWLPTASLRQQVLVENPARLYGF